MSIKLTEGGLQLPRWLAYNCRDEWPGYAEIHNMKIFNKLAYWCKGNRDLMIETFENTPYFKTKDKKHLEKWTRDDYRKMTVEKAILGCERLAKEDNHEYNNILPKIDFNATLSLCDGILYGNTQKRVKTGFMQLDSLLNGGFESGYITIGALPSVGKTTFALQTSDNIAFNHNDVLFVALEQNSQTLIRKSISRLTNNGLDISLSYADVEQCEYVAEEKKASFNKAFDYYKKTLLHLCILQALELITQ